MSLSGINMRFGLEQSSEPQGKWKAADGSDNVCSGNGLVNRTFDWRSWLNLRVLGEGGQRSEEKRIRAGPAAWVPLRKLRGLACWIAGCCREFLRKRLGFLTRCCREVQFALVQ